MSETLFRWRLKRMSVHAAITTPVERRDTSGWFAAMVKGRQIEKRQAERVRRLTGLRLETALRKGGKPE